MERVPGPGCPGCDDFGCPACDDSAPRATPGPSSSVAFSFERWRFSGGAVGAKGMSEAKARELLVARGGTVSRSEVTVFEDGAEHLGRWVEVESRCNPERGFHALPHHGGGCFLR